MRARKIAERHLRPTAPVRLQQTRPTNTRIDINKRIVISQHSWTTLDSALVRGHDIPERWALVKNVVPRKRKIARPALRPIFQRQVRDHPRAKMKLRNVPRRIVAIRPHDVARDKLRRGKDHVLRMKTTRLSAIVIERDDIDTVVCRYQLNRRAIELNVCFRLLKQVLDQ